MQAVLPIAAINLHRRKVTAVRKTSTMAWTPTATTMMVSIVLLVHAVSLTVFLDSCGLVIVDAKKTSSSSNTHNRYRGSPQQPRVPRRRRSPAEEIDTDFDDSGAESTEDNLNTEQFYDRRRRKSSNDSASSKYNDYDDDDDDDDAENDYSWLNDGGEYDEFQYDDDGLLDDEAESILLALERSEQQQQRQKRKQVQDRGSKVAVTSSQSKMIPRTSRPVKKNTNIGDQKNRRRQSSGSHYSPQSRPVLESADAQRKKSKTTNTSPARHSMHSRTDNVLSGSSQDETKNTNKQKHYKASQTADASAQSATPRTSTITVKTSTGSTRPSRGIVAVPTRSATAVKSRSATTSSVSAAGTTATSSTTTTSPWIRQFLQDRLDDKLLCVPKDFIADNFNLSQLPPIIERIAYHVMGPKLASDVSEALKERRQLFLAEEQQQQSTTPLMAPTTSASSTTTQQQMVNNNNPSPISSLSRPAAPLAPPSLLISQYPIYKSALKLILSEDGEYDDEDAREELGEGIIPFEAIQVAAEALYLFVHARFITSPRGLETVRQMMLRDRTRFGKCPRPMCCGTGTIPFGYSNSFTTTCMEVSPSSLSTTKCHRYCPSCGEVWMVWDSRTSGCAWGPSFCHLLLLAHGTQIYEEELRAIAEASKRTMVDAFTTSSSLSSHPATRSGGNNNDASRSAFSPKRLHDDLSSTPTTNTNFVNAAASPKRLQSSSPAPSVYGFHIHPGTTFGRPWRLSNDEQHTVNLNARGGGDINSSTFNSLMEEKGRP